MKKWLILGGVMLAAMAAVAVAVFNLEAYLNENKEWLEEQAAAAVGRPVAFGRVGVGLWPGLAVDVESLRIEDDPAYSEGKLLEIDEVRVRVDLWSAIFGDLEVSGISLERPVLSVVRTDDGLNLDGLGSGDADSVASSDAPPLAAVIAFLDVKQGEIRYLDRSVEPHLEMRIRQLEFAAEDLSLVRPVRFSLAASVLAEGDAQNLRVEGSAGPISADSPDQTPIDLRVDGSWAADGGLAELANLPALGLALVGDLVLAGTLSGSLERLALDIALDATRASVRYEDSFAKPAGTPFELSCAGTLQDGALEIRNGALLAADAKLTYRGRIDLGTFSYDVALASAPIDLAQLETLLPGLSGLGLSGHTALDLKAAASGAVQGLPKLAGKVDLSDVDVRLPDQPSLTGLNASIQLRDGGAFMAESPVTIGGAAGTLSLRVPDLDAPVAAVHLKSSAGSYSGIDYDSLDIAIAHTVATSVTTIDRMQLASYGGELSASGSYDASEPTAPVLDLDSRITSLRLERLLAALFDPAARVAEGKLGSELRFRGVGADWDALKKTLTGAGALSLDDGVLHKVNLGGDLLGQLSSVPGLQLEIPAQLEAQYPAVFGQTATHFENLRGQLSVREGRVFADALRLAAADYAITASGSVSLDADVALRANFSASKALSQSLIEVAKPLRYLRASDGRIEIPFWLRGGVSAMRIEPDMQYLAQRVAPALMGDLIGKLGGKKATGKDDGRSDAAGEPAEKPPDDATDPAAAAGAVLRDLLRPR